MARRLLGQDLVRFLPGGTLLRSRIVEVEAYLSQRDLASHSHRGPNRKNASMFREAGTLYVYPIHGRYCMNVVTEQVGCGSAVLIRAAEPLDGLAEMAEFRGLNKASGHSIAHLRALGSGPGRLCEAMAVSRHLDGADLMSDEGIWLEPAVWQCDIPTTPRVKVGKRIGISKSQNLKLRWFLDGHAIVSGLAREHSCGRHWLYQDA